MGVAVKSWTFTADAEGLADAGNAANLAFATDGAGAVKFTTPTKNTTQQEFALRATTGETWATWGVPAGQIVTSIQITAWSKQLVTATKLSSHSFAIRVVGSDGLTVHSAGDLVSGALGTSTDVGFVAQGAGTARAVNANRQALTTDVRLKLDYTVVTANSSSSAAIDQRFDTIDLTMTYSAAPTGGLFMSQGAMDGLGVGGPFFKNPIG